jgi:hypothetical protein
VLSVWGPKKSKNFVNENPNVYKDTEVRSQAIRDRSAENAVRIKARKSNSLVILDASVCASSGGGCEWVTGLMTTFSTL